MDKIFYCWDKSSKETPVFPKDTKKITKIKDIPKEDFALVIFDERFLKKRQKLDLEPLSNKICLILFNKRSPENKKIIKRFGFFDYFSPEDSKFSIHFKFKRATQVLNLKKQASDFKEQLAKKHKQIEKILLVDPLTGCYNWRYFLNRTHQELSASRRHMYSISFIAVDIDYFRKINELYGAKAADVVAKKLANILRDNLRKEDVLARWSGDEFFIILPQLKPNDVKKVAVRIKYKIEATKFLYKNLVLNIKTSVGVVSSPEDGIFNTRDIVNALDKCLIYAKRRGGSTIIAYSQLKFKKAIRLKRKASVEDLRGKIEKMNILLSRDLLEMIYGFARAIEAKDSYTGKHVEYTATLAEEIAKALHLSGSELEDIKHAAVLHDLGKVGIKESILSKQGPLTYEEREIIKTHPSIAAEILRGINALRGAVPAILYHHERYDGKGYPMGLKGEEIPLGARILAVADVYQALISDRPYRKGFSKKKALKIMEEESGKQFDPKITKIFLDIIKTINDKT